MMSAAQLPTQEVLFEHPVSLLAVMSRHAKNDTGSRSDGGNSVRFA